MQRAALPIIVLVILGLAVWSLWTTRPQPPVSPDAAPTTGVVAAETPPSSSEPPAGFRLAGLAVGDPESFAAIELPDGTSHLYKVDSNVPGLGRVARITNTGAAIEGEHGTFTLKLKPAATPTADRRRINGESGKAPTTPSARPGDDTALEPTA